MPRSITRSNINLPLNLKIAWCAILDESPDFVGSEIRDEDLSVGLERHMRIRRATVHRELDDRRDFLEMKRVSRDGSDQGAVGRSKVHACHFTGTEGIRESRSIPSSRNRVN